MKPKPARRIGARRWRSLRRRFNRWVTRVDLYPRLEVAIAAIVVVLGLSSYAILTGQGAPAAGFSPPMVTLLLVANLLPLMALLVLIARRIALLLTARRKGTAGAKLHVRLVALFSAVAAVPTLLVVVFASLLFQFGVQFWFSDRVKTVLGNADHVAQAYVDEKQQRILEDGIAMAADLRSYGQQFGYGSKDFVEGVQFQLPRRHLTTAAVFSPTSHGFVTYAAVKMETRPLAVRVSPQDLKLARVGVPRVLTNARDRIEAVMRIDDSASHYLYISTPADPQVLAQVARTRQALDEYQSLISRSRNMVLRFNGLLIVVSLLILSAAIWFALWLANSLVTPIARLADAAERVGAGDLDARVPTRGSPDELGTLARAFNRMTGQLKAQQTALVTANSQLDRRRQFSEAVLAGVSAGVLSIDAGGIIRLANHSAATLLQTTERALAGQPLAEAVPQLAALLDEAAARGDASGVVEIVRGPDTQTLAVQIAAERSGARTYVLTFDDITAQLADQRQAAWADVARRIAHEIKNPLTPIQLSAERLQRKYARQIVDDPATFANLTGTIVRQVGDLRRMVDEFSSFARMPKPVFKPEPVVDIAREAVFMQEVANPAIAFEIEVPDAVPLLVCDRRQIAQALTNLLKNATEAVAARTDRDGTNDGRIILAIEVDATKLLLRVTDNGIGLPIEQRDRLTEPYVTTRARGTGLGLAIVKKIVEEHEGVLDLGDAAGGGTVARLCFNRTALADYIDINTGSDDAIPARRQLG
ncbi:HAMP domain-containing protein [Polymorphobacter sp. PAMC 29334]|uniref:sensor histidine kinase NtrY-like n=1 Tax=Polymorphobacter sp. PAMC 29334 TaxID=2862331 RepID=UPI001C79348E|nr:ATP-binding protein [Polymorphobacter sp. PAMC 29334]QYE34215.1 HAMP domain-containing protein [Polymorphobacter sp. PAMC 29334]